MSEKADLIFELGTEELPPTALKKLSNALTSTVVEGLKAAKLSFNSIKSYATPRRLAFLIEGLDVTQEDQKIERKGPSVKAAYDADGNATKAAEGFARSCGVTVADLQVVDTPKGEWLTYTLEEKGQNAVALLPEIVKKSLNQLPIPKRMRWGSSSVEFVRPVQWVLFLLDDTVVECEILGIKSSNTTMGHRFHSEGVITIEQPKTYEEKLLEGSVICDFEERKNQVEALVKEAANGLQGIAVIDSDLLDEVTALVEYPALIVGEFERRFLDLPKEVLVSSMKKHQKYFHVETESGTLLPNFITLANVKSSDPDIIKKGNERVIRPRLEDGVFFWEKDKKTKLSDRVEGLKNILFQKQLGSLHDRSERIAVLAENIATLIGADTNLVNRAALLCKTDLSTEMVGEFPDLQGVMGQYYARNDGEPEAVASSMLEQYLPRFSGDALPAGDIGLCIALADRLDLIVGIFGIGLKPTGDKDPFGLRRAALGVIRMVVEKSLSIDIKAIINVSLNTLGDKVTDKNTATNINRYLMERAKGYFVELGFSVDVFDAVLSTNYSDLNDFQARVSAVVEFKAMESSSSLAAANKRVRNILKKSKEAIPDAVNTDLLAEPAETTLLNELNTVTEKVMPLLQQHEYTDALKTMAELRDSVDQFFVDVMVMAKEDDIRLNRLALLQQMNQLFLNIADISKLQS
ncbi:MAG: glycine--tRNA ligase subunit beta [Methylococcales bacterium]|jgi:glycyl-tRNA synthetase beta chain|nr:glycine--tRNA ligase subunit beta [Methylococcales bacterium]